MTQDEKRVFNLYFASADGVLIISVYFLRSLGLAPAAILTLLLKREGEVAKADRKHIFGEWFTLSFEAISEAVGFQKNRMVDAFEALRKTGVIESERRGLPSQNFYRIAYEKVFDVIAKGTDPSSWQTQPLVVGNEDRKQLGNRSSNTIPTTVSSNSLGIPEEENDLRDSIEAKQINEVILPILREAVRLGGFKNTFPAPGKAPTKALLFAQKFLQSAFSGRLTRDFPIENKEDQRGSLVRYLKESGRSLEEVLFEACTNFNKLRGPDYGFPDKDKLPVDIAKFFYNPVTKFSWFVSIVFKPPVPLA